MQVFSTVCLVIALVAFCSGFYLLISLNLRMLELLRAKHQQLWKELGEPGLPFAMLANRYYTDELASGRPNYQGWIKAKGYLEIEDDEVTSLGQRLRNVEYLPFAVGGVATVLFFITHSSQ
jgi:hypothetical protein